MNEVTFDPSQPFEVVENNQPQPEAQFNPSEPFSVRSGSAVAVEERRKMSGDLKKLQAGKVSDSMSGWEKFAARGGTAIKKAGINIARASDAAQDFLLSPFGSNPYRDTLQNNMRLYSQREAELTRDAQLIDDNSIAGQLVEGTGRALVEMPLQLIPGAAAKTTADAVRASALAGGFFQGASQFGQDRGEGRSISEALPYAVTSGLITALTTKAFGATGLESVFKTQGIQGVSAKLLKVLREAGLEFSEEAVDQFQQDLLERTYRNPQKPIGDTVKEVLMSGAIGGFVGGIASGIHAATPEPKPSDFQKALDATLRDVDRLNKEAGKAESGFNEEQQRNRIRARLAGKPVADEPPVAPGGRRVPSYFNQPTPPTFGEAADEAQSRQENDPLVDLIMKGKANENPPSPQAQNQDEAASPVSPVQRKPTEAPPAQQAPPGTPQPQGNGDITVAVPTMEFARRLAGIAPKDFVTVARNFNNVNLELGRNVTDEELAELERLRDAANQRVTEAAQKAEKSKALADAEDYGRISTLPQFYNEAIAEAKAKRANKETPVPPVAANQPAAPVAPKAPVVVSTGKPNGAKAEIEYEVVEAASLKPMIQREVNQDQTRQRVGNIASNEQIAKIATQPDPDLLLESQFSTVGAPIVDDVVIAGNGRVSGLISGYEGSTQGIQNYRRAVVTAASRLGLGDVSGMVNPILIRRVKRYTSGDKSSFVVESNPKYAMLRESVSESAMLDAQALGDISAISFTDGGTLTADGVRRVAQLLDAAQRSLERTTGGDYNVSEANRRVQLAALATMARQENVPVTDFIGLLESDDGRRVIGEVIRMSPRMVRLDADLQIGGRSLAALREFQTGLASVRDKAYNSLAEWYAARRNELLKSGLDENAETILKMMVDSQQNTAVLRAFFDEYITEAEYEQNQRNEAGATADIFGEKRQPKTAAEITNKIFNPNAPVAPAASGGQNNPVGGGKGPAAVRVEVKSEPSGDLTAVPPLEVQALPTADTANAQSEDNQAKPVEPFSVGSKVRAKSINDETGKVSFPPQLWTILEETTNPDFPNERIFKIQNDRTKKISQYDIESLQPVKERTAEERESSKPKTKKELQDELLKLNPALRPSIKDFKTTKQLRDAIKRERAKRAGDEPAANLGAGLPEGAGWDEAGIRGAIKDIDTAGFPVNVITAQQAVQVTGVPAAAGYGGFYYRGQIYVVSNNVARGGVAELQRLLREEVAHGLMRTKEGLALLDEALKQGQLRLTKQERDALLSKGYQQNQLLDEFVAQAASEKRDWWQKIVDSVRAYLSKYGLKLSNEEVARLLVKRIKDASSDASEVEQTGIAPSQPTSLTAEEIAKINRELNKLQDKDAPSSEDKARIAELEKMLGQRDLFESSPIDSEVEKRRNAQREEIARRQNRRLVAGQIEDQGGLFAPKGEVRQGDMFAAPPAPPAKTEAPPAKKTASNAFGDLFGELAPSRAQFAGIPGIGKERAAESIPEVRAAVRERVFNATPAVTEERTERAWQIANELTEEVTRAGNALRYRNELGGFEMGLPMLKDEVVRYAMKLAAEGNDTLLRFALDSSWQTITGGDETAAGRALRARQELSESAAFTWLQSAMKQERDAAAAAGARILPQETFLQLVRDMENLQLNPDELEAFINRVRNEQGQGFAEIVADATAQGGAPQQPGAPRQPRQRGQQSPALPGIEEDATEEDNAAERTARTILEQLQQRHSGVEWLRPDADINQVREIVRQALQGRLGRALEDTGIDPILQDPTPIVEKIQQALEEVGVESETARDIGREVETERQNRWANRRVRQMERAARSTSVRSLIEDILNTPYRAQHDTAWRRQMAIRWFQSNGLSNEQASAAADLFNREFEAAYQRAAEKVANRVLRDGAPKTNEQFERLIRSGVLDPSKPFLDKFAEASGWAKPTAEQFQKIAELEEKLADPELSPSEVAEIIEQQRTILRHVGKKDGSAARAMAESFTASLLSQAVTLGRTFWVQFAPVYSTLKDFSTAVAFDPKNALNFASALVTAYKKQGKNQLKFGWQKDAFQFHIDDITGSHNELKRVYEHTQKLIESPATPKIRKAAARVQQVYALGRFVFKLMNTIDNTQMSIGREWKVVYYASKAFKDAGIDSPQKVSQLIDAMNAVRQSEFERALDAGLDENTANVRADHRAIEAALRFVSGEAGGDYALKVLQAAENDVYNDVGRRSPGIGPDDEGLISRYTINPLMEFASNLRKKGGIGNIIATVSVGMINIPLRAARASSDFYGYGLIRYGIHKYRTNRGMETFWKQSFANELQAKHRRNVAIAGLAISVLAGFLASSTADDDANDKKKNGIFVTGSGPKSKNLRDEWIKNGWSPYTLHIVINGVKIKIPLTRVGEPLFPPFLVAGVRDNVKWAEKDAKAKGKEINLVSTYAQNFIAAQAQLLGARGIFQSLNQYSNLTEGGGGLEKNLARMIGGTAAAIVIPFKSSLSQISEMLLGPMDNSSATAIIANQFPIIGLPWQKPALNRFGDLLYNQTLSGKFERSGIPFTLQIPSDSTNDKLYGTLINKGIAPPELRRYVLEEKYGDLTDSQFSDFASKSGALLKQSAVKNINQLQEMTPEQAKKFLQDAAQQADNTAAAALGLERKAKPASAPAAQSGASSAQSAQSAAPSASVAPVAAGGGSRMASGRIRSSLASFKVPRLKKVSGRIRSRISRGFKRPKRYTGRIRSRVASIRRRSRIRFKV